VADLVVWASKPSVAGSAGLDLKAWAEVPRRNKQHVATSRSSIEAKLSHEGRVGRRIKIT